MRVFILAGALSTCACGTSFDHVTYEPIGGVPDGVLLQPRSVTLPVGVSVAARVIAFKDSGNVMCQPTLTSDDDSIMSIELADRGATVFTGVSVGNTAIFVQCLGEDGMIEGRVTNPPAK